MPSSDTIRNCFNLTDRLYEKFVLHRPIPVGQRRIVPPARRVLKVRRPEKKKRKYHKHNPMPPAVRARIVELIRLEGRQKLSFAQLAAQFGVSARTINTIAQAAGIHRGSGTWKQELRTAA